MAEVPKKLDRWGVKHEIVALILTGIRGSGEKRLSEATKGMIRFVMASSHLAERGSMAPTPPIILYEYQRKGVTKIAFRKLLILKSVILVVLVWWQPKRVA